MLRQFISYSVVALAGCGGLSNTANVQILPSQYSIGEVKSALATPVVDEVVRLKPKNVHISMCRSTPNTKVIQFNAELQARLNAKITAGFYEACPEN
ncbi:hypothetical protein [Pseudorhodoferax sp.]|uniref:hypothetical protein n=1 Tax=Pseudorhodoferax sp. TaxID=1993553 RepID=UPI002DD69B02|nr:hypothetical protein [Pseudorhodoferax sp.]